MLPGDGKSNDDASEAGEHCAPQYSYFERPKHT